MSLLPYGESKMRSNWEWNSTASYLSHLPRMTLKRFHWSSPTLSLAETITMELVGVTMASAVMALIEKRKRPKTQVVWIPIMLSNESKERKKTDDLHRKGTRN